VSTNATILKLPDYTQLGRFKRLLQDWVDYDQRLLAGHNTPPGEPQVAGKRKKHNRASKPRKHRQLTPRQVEVVQVVGECKGNISQAAKRLGRDRATIEESYRAKMRLRKPMICGGNSAG
jgi:transcriptional regulator of acetoin/glycerol metabolism